MLIREQDWLSKPTSDPGVLATIKRDITYDKRISSLRRCDNFTYQKDFKNRTQKVTNWKRNR